MSAAGPRRAFWQVAVFARGDCAVRGNRLSCRTLTAAQQPVTTRSAPAIDGFPAYWDFPSALIFEYARGGWATLTLHGADDRPDQAARSIAVHIAGALRLGRGDLPVRFPAQLTGLPAGWAVRDVMFSYGRPGPAAWGYDVARGARLDAPWYVSDDVLSLSITPASQSPLPCGSSPGPSQQTRMAGHEVTVTRLPAGREPAEQSLCTAHADGLAVLIVVSGNHPQMDVTRLVAHLKLHGPDPAHWAARPLR